MVTGRVQNVGFREFVRREASARGLTGYARNGNDGRTVEVVAEGEDSALAELLDRLRTGPRHSAVQRVDGSYSEPACTFTGFTIEM